LVNACELVEVGDRAKGSIVFEDAFAEHAARKARLEWHGRGCAWCLVQMRSWRKYASTVAMWR
jgi:hypothetical protein